MVEKCSEEITLKNNKTWWNRELENLKVCASILRKETDEKHRKYRIATLQKNKNEHYYFIYQTYWKTLRI